MFEHLLRRAIEKAGANDVIESAAGLQEAAGKEAEEGAAIALAGVGIDISSHRSRFIGDLDLSGFDVIYCMDPGVIPIVESLKPEGVRVLLVNEAEGGIPNPYGKDQAAYQLALEITEREVMRILSEDLYPTLRQDVSGPVRHSRTGPS